MKNSVSSLLRVTGVALLCGLLSLPAAIAQKIGATLHFGVLSPGDAVSTDRSGTTFDYTKNYSRSLVLRKFIQKKWAIRVGGTFNNIEYTLENIVNADTVNYNATRRDAQLALGLERHFFVLDKHLDLYGGAQIPVVFVGSDDIIGDTYNNISNNTSGAGVGVIAGASYRLLGFRFGCEYNWSYSAFKSQVWDNASTLNATGLRRSAQEVAFTVGVFL